MYRLTGRREQTHLALKAVFLELQTPKFMPQIDVTGLTLNSLDGHRLLIRASLGLGAVLLNCVFQGLSKQLMLIKYF